MIEKLIEKRFEYPKSKNSALFVKFSENFLMRKNKSLELIRFAHVEKMQENFSKTA